MRLYEFDQPQCGDILEIEVDNAIVETVIAEINDGFIVCETSDSQATALLKESYGRYYCSTDKKWKERKGPKQSRKTESLELDEDDDPCWVDYRQLGMKEKDGKSVPNCIPAEESFSPLEIAVMEGGHSLEEAEYQGRPVRLNKPMRGDVKKFKVYVRNPKTGKIVKVNFGDPDMRIKKSNPKRRKSFRARHRCDNPGPKTKARYWSCRAW